MITPKNTFVQVFEGCFFFTFDDGKRIRRLVSNIFAISLILKEGNVQKLFHH